MADKTYEDFFPKDSKDPEIIQLSKKNKEYFKNYLRDLVNLDKDSLTISYDVGTKKDKPEKEKDNPDKERKQRSAGAFGSA